MTRENMIRRIEASEPEWDILVIGGGATGAGVAVDAATRGYRTLLVEHADFGQETSSKSTKLAHGGVRYLQHGDIGLVFEGLQERGRMIQNAPHLVERLQFIIPAYRLFERPYYRFGLGLYDLLAGQRSLGVSKSLSAREVADRIPTISKENLKGGVAYYDGQFDDSRMVVNLVRTAADHGATVLNYASVTGFNYQGKSLRGATVRDRINNRDYTVTAKCVINATGPFVDTLRTMDDPAAEALIQPSQGAHIVLDKSFRKENTALMIPRTSDGRVLFAIPWHGQLLVGTTETPLSETLADPLPQEQEIDFLLENAGRYIAPAPTRADIRGVYAGIRPLVRPQSAKKSADVSRSHTIEVANSGLVTITGGKWTTYRKMAADTVTRAAATAGLPTRRSITESLPIHGYHLNPHLFGNLASYGSDALGIIDLQRSLPDGREHLTDDSTITKAEVLWAVRHEMARTVEDVLARRTRALFLNATDAAQLSAPVAQVMAEELDHDGRWQRSQIEQIRSLSDRLLHSTGRQE